MAPKWPTYRIKSSSQALQPESIATATRLIEGGVLSDTAQAFVHFVELCERKEREHGEPCRVIASA